MRTGCNREIDAGLGREVGDLLGRALVQVQLHFGVLGAKLLDDARQDIPRLGVSRRDRHGAALLVLDVRRQSPDVFDLLDHPDRVINDVLARRGDSLEVPPFPLEYLKAKLVLEQLDLLADTGLRRMQHPRGRGDVESLLHDRNEVPELMKLHA